MTQHSRFEGFFIPCTPRVRSYAFVVLNILNIMVSLNLINLLINRARTRAALGTLFSKRTPPPSSRRTAGGNFDPPNRPKANIHRLFGDPRGLRKSIDFRTPQNRPRWVTKSPIGRPLAAKGSIWHPPHPPGAWRVQTIRWSYRNRDESTNPPPKSSPRRTKKLPRGGPRLIT